MEPCRGETGSAGRQKKIGVLIVKIILTNLGISMLLDIELSWQGMERERRLVDRISHFLVKSGQVVFAKTHCEL